jgi:hypothetical protein
VTKSPLARGLLGALLAVALFVTCFERTTSRVQIGLRGEAASNPYLAAERLLSALGLDTTALDGPHQMRELPGLDTTLILPGNRFELPARRSAELVDWVRRGGHLVVVAWTIFDDERRKPDPILDPLGVRQFWTQGEDQDEDLEEEDETPAAAAELAEWVDEPGAAALLMEFLPAYSLELVERTAVWSVSDAGGVHGLSVAQGEGHVTVWTDDLFLTNDKLQQADHATAVHRLAQLYGKRDVWIVRGNAVAVIPWRALLARGGCIALAAALWLGIHLWRHAPRFGPVQPDPRPGRRELMEHVQATGAFLLQHGDAPGLLAAVRQAMLDRMRVRHVHWLALPPAQRARRVAEWTGLPLAKIETALHDDLPPLSQLARRVKLLEEIRRKL